MRTLYTIILIFSAFSAMSQKELKTTHIDIFKNGNYFIVKEGKVNAENGSWSLPLQNFNPMLSTFWASSTKENKVSRIGIKEDVIKIKHTIQAFDEALNFNQGKSVKLTYSPFADHAQINTIEGVLESYSSIFKTAKFKTKTGTYVFVPTLTIIELTFLEAPNEFYESDSLVAMAKFIFDKKSQSVPLKLSYMQSGISWNPSYSIRLIDDKKLFIELNAIITNHSEDIEDADVSITLGAASFKYGNTLDPLIINYVGGIAADNTSFLWNQLMYSNTLTSGIYSNAITSGNPRNNSFTQVQQDPTNQMEQYSSDGEKSEDLFRYKLGRLSISKNSRMSTNIFGQEIPYEHVYDVDIPDYVNYHSSRSCFIEREQPIWVYHSLKLQNTTPYPFTTGPAFIQDNKMLPLAQDQVKYTSVGGKVKVQLAKANEVNVMYKEKEMNGNKESKTFENLTYYKAEIEGEIKVENNERKNITLNISKHIEGEIVKVSDQGTIQKSRRFNYLNADSNADWSIELKPGVKKSITYWYEVYYR